MNNSGINPQKSSFNGNNNGLIQNPDESFISNNSISGQDPKNSFSNLRKSSEPSKTEGLIRKLKDQIKSPKSKIISGTTLLLSFGLALPLVIMSTLVSAYDAGQEAKKNDKEKREIIKAVLKDLLKSGGFILLGLSISGGIVYVASEDKIKDRFCPIDEIKNNIPPTFGQVRKHDYDFWANWFKKLMKWDKGIDVVPVKPMKTNKNKEG